MSALGHVYIAEFSEGIVKVGFSKSPHSRIKNISHASGRKLTRFRIGSRLRNAKDLEGAILDRLSGFRMQGEWLSCTFERAVAELESMQLEYQESSPEYEAELRRKKSAAEEVAFAALRSLGSDSVIDSCTELLFDAMRLVELREAVLLDSISISKAKGFGSEKAMLLALMDQRYCYIEHFRIMSSSVAGERLAVMTGRDIWKAADIMGNIRIAVEAKLDEAERMTLSDLHDRMAMRPFA